MAFYVPICGIFPCGNLRRFCYRVFPIALTVVASQTETPIAAITYKC